MANLVNPNIVIVKRRYGGTLRLESLFKFIPQMAISLLVVASPAWAVTERVQATLDVPVLQGYTNSTDTLITILREPGQDFVYEIIPSSTAKLPTVSIVSNDVGLNHNVDTLEIGQLDKSISYQLIIKNKSGKIIDSRNFKSLDQNVANPKAAVCSCSRIGVLSPDDKQRSMWDRLADQKPNAIFFLGDLVYGDNAFQAVLRTATQAIAERFPRVPIYQPEFEQIQKKFITSWKKERLYRQENLIPMYSIWDDHDFGFDSADRKNPYKLEILKLYRSYYPLAKEHQVISRGPGASYSFMIFGKKFLMLDNRSFSSLKDKIILGDEQIRWIEKEVAGQKEIVIASGMSIVSIGKTQKSLQRSSPTEWEQFRRVFSNNPDLRAVFLTGDVHYSEVRDIPEHVLGFKTLQIVSSAMHSTSPWITPPFHSGRKKKDQGQLLHVGGRNFAMLDMESIFKALSVTYHRSDNKPPVTFVGESHVLRCERFYSSKAM